MMSQINPTAISCCCCLENSCNTPLLSHVNTNMKYLVIKAGGVAYCQYQLDGEGVYPLFTNPRPGRLLLCHATLNISSSLCHTDTSYVTHALSWRGLITNLEPSGPVADALPTEINRHIYSLIWKCLWCDCYHCKKWTQWIWVQILNKAGCISYSVNTLETGRYFPASHQSRLTQGLLMWGEPQAHVEANTKNAWFPSAFPFMGCLRNQAINLTLPLLEPWKLFSNFET